MKELSELFEIELKGQKLQVQKLDLPKQVVFRVTFNNNKPPLMVLRASDFGGSKFWTSMAEGRQIEAEEIGSKIEEYFRSKL
ncbi:MAG: hypothetical protein ABUT20_52580 [Bacteroidota bacterium]